MQRPPTRPLNGPAVSATTWRWTPTAPARCASPTSPSERHRPRRLRHGRRDRRLRQRRLGRPLSHRTSAATSCCGTTATARSATSRARAGPTIRRLERLGGVRRLRPRRLARSLRRQLPDLQRSSATSTCLNRDRAAGLLPAAGVSARSRAACFATAATARSRTSRRRALVGGAYGPALGVVDGRLQRRRLDRHLRRQRRQAEPALDQPAERHASRTRRSWPARRSSGDGHAEAEHGRRRRRLRQRRRRGSVHHQLTGADEHALRQRRRRASSRIASAGSGLGAPSLAVHRLRHRLVRLRQRRLARPAGRQRRVATIEAQARANDPFPLQHAEAAVPQPRQRTVRGRHQPRAGAVFQLLGRRPRRGVRRSRQRRRHRRRRRQRQRARCSCSSTSVGNRSHWLGLRLVGAERARDMLGARVAVIRERRSRRSGAARAPTAATPRPTIRACWSAWTSPPSAVRVRVAWPDGVTETFGEVPPHRYTTLVRGKGTPAAGR